MTPYVELQVKVIEALFKMAESDPKYVRGMAKEYRGFRFTGLSNGDYTKLRNYGFREPSFKEWDWNKALVEIIVEQVDDSGPEIVIRNQLGSRLVGYGETMTLRGYLRTGNGNKGNWLRTGNSAQPGALRVGDVLQTGEKILSEPREGGNDVVLIHLDDGLHGTWISVPARIPIALHVGFDGTAESLT